MSIRSGRGRRLYVTGGSGFLGRHVVEGPTSGAWDVLAPGSGDVDVRVRDDVIRSVRDWRPTAIVHTAYRRTDRRSIVDASAHLAEAAVDVGARLVHVSSDALFAGRDAPYTEADPPSPIHDYGVAKAGAEAAVARIDPSAVIVRTSLIVGTDRLSGHERAVRDALAGHSEMEFFTDEIRSPVLAPDLAAALVELARTPDITGVLHLGGPDALSRAELALMIAARHGWDASGLRFSTIGSSGMGRPARVVLDSGLARSLGLSVRGPTAWV